MRRQCRRRVPRRRHSSTVSGCGSEADQRLLIALYSPLVLNRYIKKDVVVEYLKTAKISPPAFMTVFRKIERRWVHETGTWGISAVVENDHPEQGRRLHPPQE